MLKTTSQDRKTISLSHRIRADTPLPKSSPRALSSPVMGPAPRVRGGVSS